MGERRIGPYLVLAELGRGAMGVVYRARDERSGRDVALKVCTPGLATAEEGARFVREGRLLAQCAHPNLIRHLDAGVHVGAPYLVMELAEEGSLADRLKRERTLPPAVAAEVVAQTADGVHALHVRGLIHRDLKPANVLLAADGSCRVCDLGIARGDALSRLTETGVLLGTPAYLSPEQASGNPASPATDVYSLGVMLYELLSGSLPFNGNALDVLRAHALAPPPSLGAEVPPALRQVVLRCLEKDPLARYATGGDLAHALRGLDSEEATARAPRGAAGLALALALAGLAALGGVVLTRSTPGEADPEPVALAPQEKPLDSAQWLAQGEAALSEHDWLSARQSFGAATDLDPSLAAAWLGQAKVAALESRYAFAHQLFERATTLDPRNNRAWFAWAQVAFRNQDTELGRRALVRYRELAPGTARLAVLEARAALLNRNPTEGERFVDRALALDPRDAEAHLVHMELAVLREDYATALAALERAQELESRPSLTVQEIRLRHSAETIDWVAALAGLNRAFERHPKSVELAAARAFCGYQSNLDLELALERFERALALDPFALTVQRARAQLCFDLRKHPDLIERDLRGVLKHIPVDAFALGMLTKLLHQRQGSRRLWAVWKSVTRARPENPQGWYQCLALAEDQRRVSDMPGLANELWRLEPTPHNAAQSAIFFFVRGDYPASLAWVRRGLDLPAERRFLAQRHELEALALCLSAREGDEGALRSLEQLTAAPQRVSPVVHLGKLEAYRATGRGKEAARVARALLYPHADPTYFAYCQEIVLAVPLRKALVRVSIDAGQHGTAYGLLHTLLQGRPDDVECLDLLAELYALHGARYEASGLAHLARHVAKQRAEQPLKASPALRAALARPAPADAVAERTHAEWLKVAGHYVNTRQVSHAQVALRAALAHQPGSREARILLARLEQLQGGPNFVLDTLQTACDLPPDHAEAFARRGLVLLSAKEVGPARAHIDRALTADPDLPLARAADVALQWTHDPQGGRAASEALLGEFPADPDVAEVLHRCYVDAGDPAGAADFLDRHLRAAPQSLVWTDRLILDMNAGRLDALAEGLARAPNPRGGEPNMLAATLRAHLLSRRSDSPELRDLADWIVEHNALNPMILMLVANVARAVNDEGRLLGVLKRMFRLAKPEERLDMLQILRLFGLREETLSEAAAWAAEEIARDPSCTAGYVLAVCVAVARRRPDDALQFARRIQEIPDALPGELRLAREVVAQAPGGGPR